MPCRHIAADAYADALMPASSRCCLRMPRLMPSMRYAHADASDTRDAMMPLERRDVIYMMPYAPLELSPPLYAATLMFILMRAMPPDFAIDAILPLMFRRDDALFTRLFATI